MQKIDKKNEAHREHLQKVFNSISSGEKTISVTKWLNFCRDMHINLDEDEIVRVFESIDKDKSETIDFEEFNRAVEDFRFLEAYVTQFDDISNIKFTVSPDYDYDRSTWENYMIDEPEFHGKYAAIRAKRDFAFHKSYTKERQLWQDSLLDILTVREDPQPAPWIVYTCGPMGAGKGYAFSWMSKNNYFPLEHVVHIDPDYFKSAMPEWKGYVEQSAIAGTLCHKESGYIAEIAQEIAMQNKQHIWVDGSLRDGKWYCKVFDDIRARYPEYSIGIFYVYASEDSVVARALHREKLTGRSVPSNLIRASFDAPDKSLGMLTHRVDFVARINNEGSTPKLEAFERIDRTGDFNILSSQFAKTFHSPYKFPDSLAPMRVQNAHISKDHFEIFPVNDFQKQKQKVKFHSSLFELFPENDRVPFKTIDIPETYFSNRSQLNIGPELAAQLLIPVESHYFAWCSPAITRDKFESLFTQIDLQYIPINPALALLIHGGFAYFDGEHNFLNFNAIVGFAADTSPSQKNVGERNSFLQFHNPKVVSQDDLKLIQDQVIFTSIGLDKLLKCRKVPTSQAWLQPGHLSVKYGGFLFKFKNEENQGEEQTILFQME
eukprot:c20253_g2_i3.p1 GENE.c20253_g2_i3~~c20253_g2_i3.p1  ORF type:complete len:619 (-),score=226.48 c20253_g2_i3:100-1911(-)